MNYNDQNAVGEFGELQHSPAIDLIITALALASMEFKPIKKEAYNPFHKSHYDDLADVIDATRPALSKYGIVIIQSPKVTDNLVSVTTFMGHTSGQWFKSILTLPASKKYEDEDGNIKEKIDAQSVATGISYGRRYARKAMLDLAAVDDDGNQASGHDGKDKGSSATSTRKTERRVDNTPSKETGEKRPTKNDEPPEYPRGQTERLSERNYGKPSEEEKPVITDADLPDNMQPGSVEGDPLPTKEERKAFVVRAKAYNQDSEGVKAFLLRDSGLEDVKVLPKIAWEVKLAQLEDASKQGTEALVKLIKGE